MILFTQKLDLLLGQAGETEHADLIGDVLPGPGCSLCLEPVTQSLAHGRDTTAHRAQILLPHSKQLGIVQNTTSDLGSVRGRVRDLRALQDSKLTGNVLSSLSGVGTGSGDEMEGAGALAVQTEILSERLRNAQLETLLDKVADSPGITDEITRRETLIRAVEEGEVVAFAHD